MDGKSVYAGSLDVTYLVSIPANRGPVRVVLSKGLTLLRAGTATPMVLGESDVARLYKACPEIKIRPQVASKTHVANPVTPEAELADESAAAARPEPTAEPEKKSRRRHKDKEAAE